MLDGNQCLRPVRAGIIQQNQIQALRIGLGEIVQKALDHRGRERRKFHKVVRAADRFDRPEGPGILEAVLVDTDRFDGPRRNPPPMDRMQPKPTRITGPNPHRLLIGRRNGIPQVRHKVGFKIVDGRRVFLGLVGRGTLRLARSLYRTSLWTALRVLVVPKVVLIHMRIAP